MLPTVPRAAGDPPTGSGASSDPGSSFTPVNTANSAGAAGVSDTTAAGTGSASTDAAFADNAGPTIMPAAGVALGPARRVARQVHRAGRDGAAYLGLVMFPIAGAAAIWAFNTRTPGLRGIGPFARPAPVAADGLGAVAAPTEGGIARFRRRRSEPFVPLR